MKLYISSCNEVRRGTKDGRAWVLYQITDPQGNRYSTFDSKYVGMVGQEAEVEVRETPSAKLNPNTGQPYMNKTIVTPKQQAADNSKVLFLLQQINGKLDTVLDLLKNLAPADEPPKEGGPDGTDELPENLPC